MLAIITGASKGFGRAAAVEIAKRYGAPMTMILLARSADGLAETKSLVENESKDIVVQTVEVDLANLDTLDTALTGAFSKAGTSLPPKRLLVNNAGVVGELCPVGDTPSLGVLRKEVDLNVTSCMWLTNRFLKELRPAAELLTVVNVSSLAGVQPFATWSSYCTGKAARDMFHRVLAEEHKADAAVRVLNWAPGPMDTDMAGDIRASTTVDPGIHEWSLDIKRTGKLLAPALSAKHMLDVLIENKFESGAHIDVYDVYKPPE